MKTKKVMLLGGNYFQMTATLAAKKLGCHVISIDYIPDNPAHKYADEYYNISTTDREEVLKLSEKLKIDGIVSYASDVSAPTAAFVAERLGLPTNPYASVELLTRKDLTRDFLKKNNFKVPISVHFSSYNEYENYIREVRKPVVVKPADSSGSKGVSKINDNNGIKDAWNRAIHFSMVKKVVVEEFIKRKGYQIAGDGFIVNGKLAFTGMAQEHFDKLCNPFVPIGESFPLNINSDKREAAIKEIQRLLTLLEMKQGAINLDFIFDENDTLMILEIAPRNGGNLITDAIKYGSGVDLAKYTIMAALGEDCTELKEEIYHEFVASYIIHGITEGRFGGLEISENIKNDIILQKKFVRPGDRVEFFNHGGLGLGAMLIRFNSHDEMLHRMDNMEKYIKIITI